MKKGLTSELILVLVSVSMLITVSLALNEFISLFVS